MMQTENDLDKAQEDLATATSQLEDKEKKVQEVSRLSFFPLDFQTDPKVRSEDSEVFRGNKNFFVLARES